MNPTILNGRDFKTLLSGGLNNLKLNIETVNDLNVFPIPDGDTGDNMFSTMLGGVKAASDSEDLREIAAQVGRGMLLGARGNSGVILSQFFAGITHKLALLHTATIKDIGEAFDLGVEYAYKAVAKPVEGTMLTVIKDATEYANNRLSDFTSIADYFTLFLKAAEISLEETPELLYVLKEAGVVDSGGAGIVYIVKGFVNAINGINTDVESEVAATKNKDIDFSLFNEDSVMKFGYCTEFLLQLTKAKINIDLFDLEKMKEDLSTFGDSLVAVKTGSVVKIHVHTMTPGAVLEYAQRYGEFLTLKIENMTLQHNETLEKPKFKRNAVRKKFATIAVSNGSGLSEAFTELGADLIVDGGQGHNPSVELFLQAFDAVNSDNIFVLPNNGNIMMAAKEAALLYEKSCVKVINAKTLGDGYAVLSSLEYNGDADEIAAEMERSISDSRSCLVSKAVRDAVTGGVCVKNGEYIGFEGKNIIASSNDPVTAAVAAIKALGGDQKDFIVTFFGSDVQADQKSDYKKSIGENFPNAESYEIDGGQDIYDFVVVLQ